MAGKAFLRSAWDRLSTIWRYSGVLLLFLGGRPLSKMWKRAQKEQQNTCRNFFPSTKPTCVQQFKAATTSNQQQTRTTYPKVLHKHCGGFTNCNTKYLLEVVALRRLQLIFPTCGRILFLLHRNSKEFTILRVQSFFFCEMKLVCLVVSMSLFRCFHLKVGWFTRWWWHTWRLMQAKHLKRQVWHNETGKWTLSKCVKLCPMLHFCAVFLMHLWKLTLELKTVVF